MKENAVILLQKNVSWVPEAPQGLNMELDLQILFGLLCTAVYSLAETPQPPPSPPAFGLISEGAIGQPR